MLFKIYAGLDGDLDYCGEREFDTQQEASKYAFGIACEKYINSYGLLPDCDAPTINYHAEEVEDE